MDEILVLALKLANFNLMPIEWDILCNLWDSSLRAAFDSHDYNIIADIEGRNRAFIEFELQLIQHDLPKKVKNFIHSWVVFLDALLLHFHEIETFIGQNKKPSNIIGADDMTPILMRLIATAAASKNAYKRKQLKQALNNVSKIDPYGAISYTLTSILFYLDNNKNSFETESEFEKLAVNYMLSKETANHLLTCTIKRNTERQREIHARQALKKYPEENSPKRSSLIFFGWFFKKKSPSSDDHSIELSTYTKHS